MDLPRTTRSRIAAVVLTAMLACVASAAAGYAPGAAATTTGSASNHRGPLTGTWAGNIAGQASGGVRAVRIAVIVNAGETGGSWKLSASCHGPLVLESISNGYHHYLRKLAPEATCAGGDIDCLKRVGANLYDAVTSHLGGASDVSGTLRRVPPR
jgi:hypothetical protein